MSKAGAAAAANDATVEVVEVVDDRGFRKLVAAVEYENRELLTAQAALEHAKENAAEYKALAESKVAESKAMVTACEQRLADAKERLALVTPEQGA